MDRISIIVTLVTINAAVLRALREDMRFFPTLKTPWRGIVVAAFTLLVAPLLDMLAQGTALKTAAVTAFLAALPTLISTIVSAFATPQTATQVVAQAVANRVASIKPPPLACLMVVLCFACVTLTGCPAVLPVLSDVLVYVEDAARILDIIRSAVNQFFAVTPNPAAQVKIEQAIGNTSLALDTLLRVGKGTKALDSQDAVAAFAQFRTAYEDLEALLKSTGVIAADGMMGVGAGHRTSLPKPLALLR